MGSSHAKQHILLPTVAAGLLLFFASAGHAQTSGAGASQLVTLTCTGSPCPFGQTAGAEAIVWPSHVEPLATRLGYTASAGLFLPANIANGAVLTITSGVASVFAGLPSSASHRTLASLSAGDTFVVSGLAPGEVLSVQSLIVFTYEFELPAPEVPEAPIPAAQSQWVTATCTGNPCPWGPSLSGYAIAWPDNGQPTNTRLGYTFSHGVYLPADRANGATVWVESGTVTLFAALPNATTHRTVATIPAGGSFEVSGLAPGEVLSAQSLAPFTYGVALPPPPPPPPAGSGASEYVTLTCALSPCPWGPSVAGHLIVWPKEAQPLSRQHNYIASKSVYLPASVANGATITIDSGTATLYAGYPSSLSHRSLATLTAGHSYVVSGLADGEVLSVLSPSAFVYRTDLSLPPEPETGELMTAVPARWVCDTPGCNSPDWVGAAFTWPSWAAYPNNGRSGDQSRTVYSPSGGLLYPYMGSWADGCEITGESGAILIIEWQRGTDAWRQTLLGPGDTHVISLSWPEDGALIEAWPGSSISVKNCEPQPLP